MEIHIVLLSSDAFVEYCATTMASILYNIKEDYSVHFYILTRDIKQHNRKKLAKLSEIHPCTIDFPEITESMLDAFSGIQFPSHVVKIAYARIYIPDLLPNVDKAIFIDSDTIVRSDISQMYEQDLGGNFFAMVEDANWKNLSTRLWGKEDGSCYFNDGVMLIDCSALRKNNYLQIIKQQCKKNFSKYRIGDQDVLNDAFKNRILRLDVTWNCYHEFFFKKLHVYVPDDEEKFNNTCENPNIAHFVGPEKPWFSICEHRFKKDYLFYNKLTPFHRVIRKARYEISKKKYLEFTLFNRVIYRSELTESGEIVQFLGIIFKRGQNGLIKSVHSKNLWILYIFCIPLIKKKDSDIERYIKFCNVPLYYSKKSNLEVINETLLKEVRSLKDQVAFLSHRINLTNRKSSNLKCIVEAQKLHQQVFERYRAAFEGRKVVLVCTGPSAKNYRPIPDAIHVGVNGAIYLDHVKLDFLFIQDGTVKQKVNSSLNKDAYEYVGNDCKKFFGIIPDDRLSVVCKDIVRVPAVYANSPSISQYVLEDLFSHNIAYDLTREPLGDFSGTPFSALQFILFTHPKTLYLVGWDCSAGYAYDKPNAINPANYQVNTVKKYFLPFIKLNYPDIEIISINPVGLKNMFTDMYMK